MLLQIDSSNEEILNLLLEMAEPPTTAREVTPETLLENLGLTSLTAVEFVMNVEDKYGIVIPNNELSSVVKIGDVLRLIEVYGKERTN